MPTPQLDDRKVIAELAEAHDWSVSEVRINKHDSKAMFEVHYVNEGVGIIAYYNWADKLMSAHIQIESKDDRIRHQDHAHRMVTLQKWMSDFGQPIEKLTFGGGEATLTRGGELVAHATRQSDGEWLIRYGHGTISIRGLPENTQRRILLATLKAL